LSLLVYTVWFQLSKWFQRRSVLKHFPHSPAVAAILNFISEQKNVKFVEDHPMNIHVQFGFNNICSFWEGEAIALIEPKLCINHWKVLYKLCVFYVDRNSKMITTAGHSFYIGPIGSFYNQVNDTGEYISVFSPYGPVLILWPVVDAILPFRSA
jgi:hypothetical protein